MKSILAVGAGCVFALCVSACGGGSDNAVPENCTSAWNFSTVKDGTLKVAAVQQLPSVDVSPTGDVEGIDSQLLPEFAKQACLNIDWQPLAGPAAVSALSESQVDIGAGGWYKTPARGEVVGQTDTVWYDSPGIVSRSGFDTIESLNGKKVGVVGGSLFEAPMKAAIGSGNVSVFQSIDAVFQELASGRIDAGLGSGAVLVHQKDARDADVEIKLLAVDPQYPELTTTGEPNYPFTKANTELGEALNSFITRARADGLVERALQDNGLSGATYLDGPRA